jgi:hypothetical protein
VRLGIGVAGLELKPHGDPEQGKIHVIFAQNDGDGRPFDYRDDTVQLDLKPGTEIVAYRQASAPNPKASQLRIIVRDESGNIGSITVPLTKPCAQLLQP